MSKWDKKDEHQCRQSIDLKEVAKDKIKRSARKMGVRKWEMKKEDGKWNKGHETKMCRVIINLQRQQCTKRRCYDGGGAMIITNAMRLAHWKYTARLASMSEKATHKERKRNWEKTKYEREREESKPCASHTRRGWWLRPMLLLIPARMQEHRRGQRRGGHADGWWPKSALLWPPLSQCHSFPHKVSLHANRWHD